MGTDGVRERYINPCADFGFEKLSGMGKKPEKKKEKKEVAGK